MTQHRGASPYPEPGEIVGESWMIEKVLGEGGMGCVARAYHTVLHTPVALKFMNPQFMIFPGAVERFINEGKASGRIKSDHVVPVMDAKKLPNGTPYLVMECLDGLDLADLLARDGVPGLPAERAVHFVIQILRGLQAAHAINIIHRDMKPSNCFVVSKDGEDDFVKILDFGISKIEEGGGPALTRTNSTLGTPLYMSPEQAKNARAVDARSDLYSVGAIFYELLAGQAPFFTPGIELLEILVKLVTDEPPPVRTLRPDLDPALAAVVHKALAREPSGRYANAVEMADALAPFASARSAHVLERLRGFRAPARPSNAPSEVLPPSMLAFSKLDRAPGEGRPSVSPAAETLFPTDAELLEAPPSNTEHMPPPPQHQLAPKGTLVLEQRTATTATATATETAAATATAPAPPFDIFPPSQARPSARGRPARSPLVYAVPIVAVFAILGGVLGVLGREGEGPAPGDQPNPSAPPPLAADPPPPAAVTTFAAPSVATPPPAELTALTAPSGAPSAPPLSPRPPTRPPVRPTGPPRDPGFDPGIKH